MSVDVKSSNDNSQIEIMFGPDEGYSRLFLTAMASVLKNANPNELLRFHILDGGLSERSRQMVEELRSIRQFEVCYYQPDVELYKKLFPKADTYGHFRSLVAAELLPETIDRVVFLDCDLLVLSSLQELWNTPLNGLFCGAVYDVHCSETTNQDLGLPQGYRYFNSGMLLVNLKVWREKKLAAKFGQIATEREGKLSLADQDIYNIYAGDAGYLELDGRWNFYAGDPVDYSTLGILHYWGKYWFWNSHGTVPARLLAKYAALTPFKKFPWHTAKAKLYKCWIYFLSLFIFPGSQGKKFRTKHTLKILKW